MPRNFETSGSGIIIYFYVVIMVYALCSAVVFIGKGGYWEGRAGGKLGWFPARAIQELTDDGDSGVFSEYCESWEMFY